MAEIKEAIVADIGDLNQVPIIEVLVAVGDRIEKDQSLVTLESEKATLEVPSLLAGVVKELRVKVGDLVSQGSVIARVAVEGLAHAAGDAAAANAPQPGANTITPASPSASFARSTAKIVTVTDLGGAQSAPVVEILTKLGDEVQKDQGILTLELEKATLEIPAPCTGVVERIAVNVGQIVSLGDEVAVIGSPLDVAVPAPSAPLPEHSSPALPDYPATASASSVHSPPVAFDAQAVLPSKVPYASPAVRVLARQVGADLSQVQGTGQGGRITREDVVSHMAQHQSSEGHTASADTGEITSSVSNIEFAQFGPTKTQPLSRLKKRAGSNLARNWAQIPHVTAFDQADITELEEFRIRLNQEKGVSTVKLTLLPFLLKACASALRAFPDCNSSLDANGNNLILKNYFHIGFAVDTPNGLVVPVIRDVDAKGVVVIAQEIADLAQRAREGKLSGQDMKGGCFSISSLGGVGGTGFTPIINAPEVAILGVSRAAKQPVWQENTFVPRLMLPLALSYDHRVIDGALGAQFMTFLGTMLSDVRRLLL